jgi:peptide-methionine (R)-S-oxide reductase
MKNITPSLRYLCGSLALATLLLAGCANDPSGAAGASEESRDSLPTDPATIQTTSDAEILMNPEELTEADWKARLTPEQYRVTREKGTERKFQNEYWDEKTEGIYHCVACNQPLYDSQTKYESGTGWPSFYQPIEPAAVREEEDNTYFSRRTEVVCSNCGSHLGHVFTDGPDPTGLRYCMNSAAMKLEPREEQE